MSFSELLAQPFLLLGVDPAATREQIQAGFELAKRDNSASEEILAAAREILLNPVRRLPYELAYPIGSPISELEEWHRLASVDVRSDDLLKHAALLTPLSRANFFYYISAQRPADATLLRAMTDAYGRLEITNVYDQLKKARSLGGYPTPSLASVREALEAQIDTHYQRTISAYGQIDEAAEAFFEFARKVLAIGELQQIDMLKRFLGAYQNATLEEQSSRLADIEAACCEIERNPEQASLLEALGTALDHWVVLCRPLLVYEASARALDANLQTPLQCLRSLVIDLALDARYERAIELATLGKEKLRLISTSTKLLVEAAVPAEQAYRMLRARKLASLTSLIDEYKQNPSLLIEALKQNGFGPSGIGAAKQLWETFVAAVCVTQTSVFVEPWNEIRALAKWLADRHGGVPAARGILECLSDHGPQIAAPPWAVESLRNELGQMSQITGSTTKTSVSPRKPAAKIFVYLAGVAIVVCAGMILFGFERPRLFVTNTLAGSFSPKAATREGAPGDEETAPTIGTRQRLTLANLRYCKFQEERLRLVQPKVQTAEDTRAFNLLVVDYNSRCSDILYRDSDNLIVQGEFNKNHQRLAEEAEQIMLTWHGLATQGQPIN
jgi:hypothetical protein